MNPKNENDLFGTFLLNINSVNSLQSITKLLIDCFSYCKNKKGAIFYGSQCIIIDIKPTM